MHILLEFWRWQNHDDTVCHHGIGWVTSISLPIISHTAASYWAHVSPTLCTYYHFLLLRTASRIIVNMQTRKPAWARLPLSGGASLALACPTSAQPTHQRIEILCEDKKHWDSVYVAVENKLGKLCSFDYL